MGGMLRRLAGRVAAVGGAEDAVADVGGLGRGLCQHRDQQHGEAMAEQAGRREAAGGEAEESGSGARAHAERSLNQALRRGQHLVCATAPPPSPPEGSYRRLNGGGLFVRRESHQIIRASCRDRVFMYVWISGVAVLIK